MSDLRPGQYRRLGRIAENNPQRAERVASGMNKRSSREERGKVIARGTGRGEGIMLSPKRPDTPLAISPTPMYNAFREAAIIKKKNLNR